MEQDPHQGKLKNLVGNILKQSAIGPDFEQKEPFCAHESNAKETAGKEWYDLPKTEMTDDVKRDIQIIKMRSVLDPRGFYKRGDKRISKREFYLALTCSMFDKVLRSLKEHTHKCQINIRSLLIFQEFPPQAYQGPLLTNDSIVQSEHT